MKTGRWRRTDGAVVWLVAAILCVLAGDAPVQESGAADREALAAFSNPLPTASPRSSSSNAGTTSDLLVPVILTASGASDSYYTSELTLTNRDSRTATLHYTYRAAAGGGSGTASETLAPGRQKIMPDAIDHLRTLGVPIPSAGTRIGTLRVVVSGSSDVGVTVRTTTQVADGRAGLAYPGVAVANGFTEAVYLCGLRQNSQDRSNVAFQNMGTSENITVRATAFSGDSGDSRVFPDVILAPGGFRQLNGILATAGFAQGYVKVERMEGAAPFYAYGVINDQANSDGSFVFPVTESSLAGVRGQTLPVILEHPNFSSELIVTNFSNSTKAIDFRFVAEAIGGADRTARFSVTLAGGEQRIIPEIVENLRRQGVDGVGPAGRTLAGAVFATARRGDLSGVVIGARTGSQGGGGQYSVFYHAVPDGAAFSNTAWIDALQQNRENRSNLALVNTGEVDDSPSVFQLDLYDGATGMLANTVTGLRVAARGWRQINGILGKYAPGTTQGYARIQKISGNNPFLAYGVINDGGAPGQRSGDGAYLPASGARVRIHDPGADPGEMEAGVCDRTDVVRALIMAKLDRQDCTSVTPGDLAEIFNLQIVPREGERLSPRPVLTLRVGDFQGLTNLLALSVRGYALTPLPAGIFEGLSRLEVLGIANNDMTHLPAGIFGGLSRLYYLRLAGNTLSSLPAGIFEGLSSLRLLSISFNDMTHLPESVFAGLVNLEFINMYGFMSEDMPFALPEGLFHGLSGLKELHLGSTPMPEALPEGIFRDLVNLEILNLNGCGDGVAAPVLYSHLKNLERLHLQNNGLSSLPDGYFVGLTKLRKLDLLGNPGAPFELKLELERTDAANAYAPGPATVQAKLATGAPFALSGSVSVLNGSASASGVSVAAGDSIADSFVVNAASAGTSTYVIIEVPETPLNYQGVELKAPEPFVLFAASDDRFPIAQGEIPHYVLQVGGPKATVDLAPYFGEPDGEELTYTVATDASNVGVDIAGSVMTVTSRSAGATTWSVRATDPQGLYASQTMETTVLRASDPASFDIDLVFLVPGDEWQNARVREAADRWKPILVGDLPDVPVKEPGLCGHDDEVRLVLEAVDDLVVFVSFANSSSAGLGSVCAIREDGGLPYTGNIVIHWDLGGDSIVRSTASHEIGHALGFGILWEEFLENPVRNEDEAGADTHFTGPLAVQAFDAAGGSSWDGGKVPVANGRDSRLISANSHWRAYPLRGELMNPSGGSNYPLTDGPAPLSAITVQSLADLGYEVDVSQADPYMLPDSTTVAERHQESTSPELLDDILRGPIIVTDSRGNFVRFWEPRQR